MNDKTTEFEANAQRIADMILEDGNNARAAAEFQRIAINLMRWEAGALKDRISKLVNKP